MVALISQVQLLVPWVHWEEVLACPPQSLWSPLADADLQQFEELSPQLGPGVLEEVGY